MTTINSCGNGLSGTTGTGLYVGQTTPTLITPILGVASATSINFGGSALGNYITTTSFTPVLTFGGASVGITYTTQTGYYVRIGNLISFTIRMQLSSKGSSTGAATITGLPVNTAANTSPTYTLTAGNMVYASGTLRILSTASTSSILFYIEATASAIVAMTDTNFGNTSDLYISGSYLV